MSPDLVRRLSAWERLAGDISLYGERTDKNIFCRGIPQNV